MTAIANYIKNVPELANEYAELAAELAKTAEKKQANRSLYDQAKEVVLNALSNEPMTISQLFDKCADALPEGFTRGKMQYAILNYWSDEVVKIDNGKSANQYRRA